MSPLTYEIEFIMELSKNIPEKHLNNDVENYLNNILIDIKKSSNNNTAPVFKNNSHHKNNKNVRHFKNNNRRHPTYNKDANATEKTIVSKTSPDKEVVSKDSIEKTYRIN